MITIIEGPDACGKTTLAKSVAFEDHIYAHQGPFQNDVLNETIEHVRRHEMTAGALLTPRNVVFDRLHLGELVYGPLLRGESLLDNVEFRMIERYLLSLQGVMVVALPPLSVMLENWERTRTEREELVTRRGQMIAVYDLYHALMHRPDVPVIVYDYTTHTLEATRVNVERVRPPVNRGPGIGHFKAGVTLLVGEQVNLNQPGQRLPFIGSVSGYYLTSKLEEWGVRESELYWINALDPQGQPTDASFINDLQPGRVVALGGVAHAWCHANDVVAHASPHPQYWRRFKRSSEYVPLQEALCY